MNKQSSHRNKLLRRECGAWIQESYIWGEKLLCCLVVTATDTPASLARWQHGEQSVAGGLWLGWLLSLGLFAGTFTNSLMLSRWVLMMLCVVLIACCSVFLCYAMHASCFQSGCLLFLLLKKTRNWLWNFVFLSFLKKYSSFWAFFTWIEMCKWTTELTFLFGTNSSTVEPVAMLLVLSAMHVAEQNGIWSL